MRFRAVWQISAPVGRLRFPINLSVGGRSLGARTSSANGDEVDDIFFSRSDATTQRCFFHDEILRVMLEHQTQCSIFNLWSRKRTESPLAHCKVEVMFFRHMSGLKNRPYRDFPLFAPLRTSRDIKIFSLLLPSSTPLRDIKIFPPLRRCVAARNKSPLCAPALRLSACEKKIFPPFAPLRTSRDIKIFSLLCASAR